MMSCFSDSASRLNDRITAVGFGTLARMLPYRGQ